MSGTQNFAELIPELAQRSALGAVSRLAVNNRPLRQFLADNLGAAPGSGKGLMADPVFEATFGWVQADKMLGELAGGLLSEALVGALGNPPTNGIGEDYAFPNTRRPYAHQLQAWEQLARPAPNSVVVTSGTGSGKTECFLVPILDDLVRQSQQAGQLTGVQALFLYPLNALINSQKDRLRAWTHASKDQVRFCLYNGMTPETSTGVMQREWPSEVRDRVTLRKNPPPILVTNATMLEYMLVRSQDAPILEKSREKLKWIVLDEAHTYIGSQAAEVALLLRRVMVAFGVTPDQVKFVATSATIGSGDSESVKQLQRFVSSLSGSSPANVTVISGRREVPVVPTPQGKGDGPNLAALQQSLEQGPEKLFDYLADSRTAVAVRSFIVGREKCAARASEIGREISRNLGRPVTELETFDWIDVLTAGVRQKGKYEKEAFLPLRAHVFHRTLPGAWACVKPECEAKAADALRDPAWSFGAVYLEERIRCECGAPVFPVVKCDECGAIVLSASFTTGSECKQRIAPTSTIVDDEFQLEVDVTGEEDEAEQQEERPTGEWLEAIIQPTSEVRTASTFVDLETLEVNHEPAAGRVALRLMVGHETEPLQCDECQALQSPTRRLFYPVILGAPFFLGQILPTVLEFAPDGPNPMESPFRGRRALAFTDSRQGSARIAAKVQQDSERQSVRAQIVARLYLEQRDDPERVAALRDQVRRLEEINDPSLADLLRERKAALESMSRPAIVSHADLVNALAASSEVGRWMLDYYAGRDANFKGKDRLLAEMCMTREFARRPRRVNNLETMGLVQVVYPEIEDIEQDLLLPGGHRIGRDDWRDFLKICLDFFVRENTIVNLPDQWRKWGGNLISQKRVLPPTSEEKASSRIKRWPREIGGPNPNRLARLLAAGLELDVSKAIDRDIVDEALQAAWQVIRSRGLLRQDGQTYYFPLEKMSFRLVEKAWVCPVTRRFLDTSFRGLTPYLPKRLASRALAECERVALPQCPRVKEDFPSERAKVAAIRDWIREDRTIQAFRAQGLWSDLNDRVLEGAGYFRAAEHSAQQPSARLQAYEQQFKQGKLNLLSCSTTMEMGVDIGGVSTVAMNNVPPHPANYLQRAGRAGRRGETRAVAVTLCKHNPHDYAVFSNPTWPFETAMTVPTVSLSSARIVQRHVNSLLLGMFLRLKAAQQQVDAIKLTSGWFHGPDGAGAPSDEFRAWCEALNPSLDIPLGKALSMVLVGTPFSGATDLQRVANASAEGMRRVAVDWRQRLANIDAEIAVFNTSTARAEPAYKALQRTRKRHTEEYLLKDLADEGFLPGYGFPSNLVQFDNFNVDQFLVQKAEDKSREDNRMLRGDFATRDLNTALREYAPGSDVVIDGIVYRSAGVTLNWHVPTHVAEVREEQYFGRAWRCRSCGAAGVAGAHSSEVVCSDCGAGGDSIHTQTFLQPAGFAVDFYEETHTDVTRQTYVAPEEPWIQAGGEWSWLPNPTLGRFRVSEEGLVYVQNSGPSGGGYAICLACGRAQPMERGIGGEWKIPKSMAGHDRLRGRSGTKGRECPGGDPTSSGLLKGSVHLGHEGATDVMEIQLADERGRFVSDASVAYTIAVAAREAAAQLLGVEPEELGAECKPLKTPAGGASHVVVLYDHNAAGYTSSLVDRVPELMRLTVAKLKCAKDCERACQHCLMSYDTRHRAAELDRKRALAVLSDAWLGKLSLPDSHKFLGAASQPEHRSLEMAIAIELQKPASQGVRIFLGGSPEDWDIASSPLRSFTHRWASTGRQVVLVLPGSAAATLAEESRRDLYALSTVPNVEVKTATALSTPTTGRFLAETWAAGQVTTWASAEGRAGVPGVRWGMADDEQLVRAVGTGGPDIALTPLATEQFKPKATTQPRREIRVRNEMNGPLREFGGRFWHQLEQKDPEGMRSLLSGTQRLVKIEYTDRYLRNPLAVGLLGSVFGALRSRLGRRWAVDDVAVLTAVVESDRVAYHGARISDDWADTATRNAVLNSVLQPFAPRTVVNALDARQVPHARVLTLSLDGSPGGKVSIWLDQGLGYWRLRLPSRYAGAPGAETAFAHRAPVEVQAQRLVSPSAPVMGQEYQTMIFVTGA